jgi:hypothetical protein
MLPQFGWELRQVEGQKELGQHEPAIRKMQISENLLAGAASIEVLSRGRDRERLLTKLPQR